MWVRQLPQSLFSHLALGLNYSTILSDGVRAADANLTGSPSGFGDGRSGPSFFRDNRAGAWASGFPKLKPGHA